MYILILKDGLLTRYIGPYLTTKQASDDLQRVLTSCSNKANWQIHALEKTSAKRVAVEKFVANQEEYFPKAS